MKINLIKKSSVETRYFSIIFPVSHDKQKKIFYRNICSNFTIIIHNKIDIFC